MRVLTGDIGGTKTLLQVADVYPNQYKILYEREYRSADYAEFTLLLKEFLHEAAGANAMILGGACIGVAGPVKDNCAQVTNLPWVLDGAQLAKDTGISLVSLINDFQAIGYGLDNLSADEIYTLQATEPVAHGPRVVIGAGTGLGEGVVHWHNDHYRILPSEGGHTDFAPADDLQVEFLQYLRRQQSPVCYDIVLSGRGIHNIYNFLRDTGRAEELPETQAAISAGDPAAVISGAAQTGNDTLAAQALDMFCAIYGSQAGNLALTAVASGGVYIAGGIAPKIIDKLADGTFMTAFHRKGKMAQLMTTLPVYVVMNPKVGVIGAAMYAHRHGKKS